MESCTKMFLISQENPIVVSNDASFVQERCWEMSCSGMEATPLSLLKTRDHAAICTSAQVAQHKQATPMSSQLDKIFRPKLGGSYL